MDGYGAGGNDVGDVEGLAANIEYAMESAKELLGISLQDFDPYEPENLKKINLVLEKRENGISQIYKAMKTANVGTEGQTIVIKELNKNRYISGLALEKIVEKFG